MSFFKFIYVYDGGEFALRLYIQQTFTPGSRSLFVVPDFTVCWQYETVQISGLPGYSGVTQGFAHKLLFKGQKHFYFE